MTMDRSCFLILVAVLGTAACDAVSPESEPILVVEAFVETGASLPDVRLRHTLPMDEPYEEPGAAAEGAAVVLRLAGETVDYAPAPGRPGVYGPIADRALAAGIPFELEARWRAQVAVASGRLPPPIRIIDVVTSAADRPVEAVLLDSLQLDSLKTGARSGYVYPVEVSLWWESSDASAFADSLFWVRTQLKPYTTPVPGVIELFFRSEQIVREDRVRLDGGLRKWTGVYLVPVESADDPLPDHSLKVAVLRSDADYARFASSRNAPDRREPVTNVVGGIGMVAGISVDSLTLRIR